MGVLGQLWAETVTVGLTFLRLLPFIAVYIGIVLGLMVLWRLVRRLMQPKHDFDSLKTVTFGDESAVRTDFAASVLSILLIFLVWGSFTGSRLVPGFLHMPGAFLGEGSFTYTATGPDGATDDATVSVVVHPFGATPDLPVVDAGDGFAVNDVLLVPAARAELLRAQDNDLVTLDQGGVVTAVNGQPIAYNSGGVETDWGRVTMTERGTLNVTPDPGWQMEPIWLPPPEHVATRLADIASEGFRNFTLGAHLGFSLFRVLLGFVLGALVGIPLGYAMGLSNWFRGWFNPIVEFMRPVPPLALIPLVIIWAGIGEVGKIILLFLAALWIMAIAARAGVSGVRITKVHAAYSLGASRWQILRHVIIPNSLPEIFTGARVAMGVCWGTVVAAELVAADKGAGMMIMTASKFQNTDIVIMGIILIGVIGFAIDVLMRLAEGWLVPWKGKA